MRHITSVRDFANLNMPSFFRRVQIYKQGGPKIIEQSPYAHKTLATLFYEPSTRTRLSFEAAMYKLGGRVISTENAKESASGAKGETLRDAIRVVSGYCDVIVLRHPEANSAARTAKASRVPLINAGDGGNEHPTQALLDLFTIWEACESGRLPRNALHIHFYGDNKSARTVRSLALMLAFYAKALDIVVKRITFDSPYQVCREPERSFVEDLWRVGLPVVPTEPDDIKAAHVLYMTRVQKERYEKGILASEPAMPSFRFLDATGMQTKAIIMHPLPRVGELDQGVDDSERAWYFKQADNGVPVRTALLEWVLE